jgi:hypothetical protein
MSANFVNISTLGFTQRHGYSISSGPGGLNSVFGVGVNASTPQKYCVRVSFTNVDPQGLDRRISVQVSQEYNNGGQRVIEIATNFWVAYGTTYEPFTMTEPIHNIMGNSPLYDYTSINYSEYNSNGSFRITSDWWEAS